MEGFKSTLNRIDIKPSKGKFTWSNKRYGPSHIGTRLERFLLSGSLLEDSLIPSSLILSWSRSNHYHISLLLPDLKKPQTHSLSLQSPLASWSLFFGHYLLHLEPVDLYRSPIEIYKKKIKLTKEALKLWAKSSWKIKVWYIAKNGGGCGEIGIKSSDPKTLR